MIKIHALIINNEFLKFMILEFIAIVNYFDNYSFIININKILYESELDRQFNLFYLKRIN